ncbi:MAG TPA: sigma-70 family RNA polymerase sigma factor [Bacillota bacterium]|nr:sigma-70 family RNA polymerase sigma factor [Bacillota bacterium]HOK71664.1 sigma-70 family RNA polymerase sigma factor [Bacillota bacterium]HOL51228.1 sigma-70 family RNA polymerase sigma factor [Bacillota bacterium]HQD80485.1 sigma-70 family RNA polymerase sigma factor [Bacillota bacterium]
MYTDLSDEQLIELHLSGDPRGMEAIYDRYFDRIYRLAYSKLGNAPDAEDVTSAVFMKLCRSLGTFRGDSKLSTWIYTVSNNAITDFLRKKRPALSLDADMMMDDGDSVPREIKDDSRGPEELACEDDFARYVMSKLEGLPPHQRTVIELRYFMELSYQEIADQLGIELGTVKSRLNRAIGALRSMCSSDSEVNANAMR